MTTMVCLYCGHEPKPGSYPLGTRCEGCGKPLMLTTKDAHA